MNNKNQKLQYNSPLLKTPYTIDNIELSLVVPSYNEENRLPIMLENTIKVYNAILFFLMKYKINFFHCLSKKLYVLKKILKNK